MRLLYPVIIVVLIVLGVFLWVTLSPTFCCSPNETLKKECCTQCKEAFGRSPVGVGPAGAICGKFTTDFDYSEKCSSYFEKNQVAVAQCKEPV